MVVNSFRFAGPAPPVGEDYHTFWVIGDSNAVGRANPIDGVLDATDPDIVQWGRFGGNDGQIILAADPLDHRDPIAGDMGFPLTFAKQYKAGGNLGAGEQVLLVPSGQGGSGNVDTPLWGAGQSLYTDELARLNAALATPGAVLKGVLINIGSNDTGVSTSFEHRLALENWIRQLRIDLGPTVPIVFGSMNNAYLTGQDRQNHNVVLLETAERFSYVGFAKSGDPSLITGGDIHFNAAGYREMGNRYYTQWVAALTNIVVDDGNLIANGDFEYGPEDWTTVSGDPAVDSPGSTDGFITAPRDSGLYWMHGNTQTGAVRQDVDVTSFAAGIDAGSQTFTLTGYHVSALTNNDPGNMQVDYLDGTSANLGTVSSPQTGVAFPSWTLQTLNLTPPVGTRVIRVTLVMTELNATVNNSAWDDVILVAD